MLTDPNLWPAGIVAMQMEALEAVHRESRRLPPIQKVRELQYLYYFIQSKSLDGKNSTSLEEESSIEVTNGCVFVVGSYFHQFMWHLFHQSLRKSCENCENIDKYDLMPSKSITFIVELFG